MGIRDTLKSDAGIAITILSVITYVLFADALNDWLAGVEPIVKLFMSAAVALILFLVVLDGDRDGGRGMLHIADIVRPIAEAYERVREWYHTSPRTPTHNNYQKAVIPGGSLIAYLLDLAIRNWDVILIVVVVSLAADRLGIYPIEDIAADLFWTTVDAIVTFIQNIANAAANWLSEQLNPV